MYTIILMEINQYKGNNNRITFFFKVNTDGNK